MLLNKEEIAPRINIDELFATTYQNEMKFLGASGRLLKRSKTSEDDVDDISFNENFFDENWNCPSCLSIDKHTIADIFSSS